MDLRRILVILFLALATHGHSQKDSLDTSPYFVEFPNAITLRSGLSFIGNSFVFDNMDGGLRITFDPVLDRRLTTSVQFRSLQVSFGFAPGFLNPNRDLEDSRVYSLEFQFFLKKWMPSLIYLDQKGFQTDINGESFYFPDYATRKIGGSLSYVFNDNFSFQAITSQNQWQQRSAGSFVPALIAYYTRSQLEGFQENETLHSYALGLGPGYHYNWVLGVHWLLSAGNTTGIGFDILEEDGDSLTNWFWDTRFRVALGYNSEHFYAGARANYNFLEGTLTKKIRQDDQLYFAEFYVGYRFDAPKFMIKKADDINRTLSLD